MSKFGEIVDWCVNSLQTEPEAWSPRFIEDKLYYVRHRCGVTVWTANGYDSLCIYPDEYLSGRRVGGLTLLSMFLGWATPWRRKLMKSARAVAGAAPRPEHQSAEDAILSIIRP